MSSNISNDTTVLNRTNIAFAITFLAGGLALGFIIGRRSVLSQVMRCNKRVQLEKDKVVDTVELEDIGDKKVFCRCWQSKKFPYCDGTHNTHNKETGDNLGPLIIKKAGT